VPLSELIMAASRYRCNFTGAYAKHF